MQQFTDKIEQILNQFSPFASKQAVISGHFFTQKEAKIVFFMEEIRQTAQLLQAQSQLDHAEIYSKKLLDQIDALLTAIKPLKQSQKQELFYSSYRFPRNVHSLPTEKRLTEYRKALRALNEKISWLLEKQFQAENEQEKIAYQHQLQETEFRKMRCLNAIEALSNDSL